MNLSIKVYLTALATMGFYHMSWAQSKEWQTWASINLKVPLSKKMTFSANQLASFSPKEAFAARFLQTSAAVSVGVNKNFSLRLGDQLNNIPGKSKRFRNRIYLRGTLSNKAVNFLKLSHSLQAELHDRNETRYRQRFILINKVSPRRRFSALSLRPSIAYSLYYNIGGDALQYYDKTGNPTVQQTADGLHRGRFSASLNSRISRHFQATIYYINQEEFNLLSSEHRNINVMNPSTGRISRPYNNFQAIGLTFQFTIK